MGRRPKLTLMIIARTIIASICVGIPSLFAQPPQWTPGQEQMEKHFIQLRANMLQKTLNFDDATREKVEQILAESQKQQKEFFKEFQKKMMDLQEQEQQKIRSVLNPEQQARFDEFVAIQKKTMQEIQKMQLTGPPSFDPTQANVPTPPAQTKVKDKEKS